jgi:predicted amidophosphoribosyltransferase
MATYKKNCIHCNELIEGDSRVCSRCGSRSPFGYNCPTCLKPIQKGNEVCSACGRSLTTSCPYCNKEVFVGLETCDKCGKTLMIHCESNRCEALQFFENKKCTVCGKPIKKAHKQIKEIAKGGK